MSETRIGDWFQSLTGRKIYPLDPEIGDIRIYEIAWALSHICRYNGHLFKHYSVAQHSLEVLECVMGIPWRQRFYVEQPAGGDRCALALAALLHDAPEAYLGDVIRPLKRGGGVSDAWLEAEKKWSRLVERAFGLPEGLIDDPAIKKADDRVLLAERRDLLEQPPANWRERDYPPAEQMIHVESPEFVRQRFLAIFHRLECKT